MLWSADCDAVMDQGLTDGEHRLLETVDLLAGGTFGIGHDFRKGGVDFRVADQVLPLERVRTEVLDLDASPIPRHLVLHARDGARAVRLYGLLTPAPAPARLPIRLAVGSGVDAHELWDDRAVRLVPGGEVEVPARSALLFRIEG